MREIYEQSAAAEDSDDGSDCDLLLNQAPVFPSRKTPKECENDSIVAAPRIEVASAEKRALTEEEFEASGE